MRAIVLVLAACGSTTSVAVDSPALTSGEHRFRSGGLELVYHVAGHGPVCVVHPGGPGLEWSYLKMPALERKLTLVYLEPVGTGKSARLADPGSYSFARWVADIEALRVALAIDKLCLIGHSSGGFVAMDYAIEHGDHLGKLLLYSTSAVMDDAWSKDSDAAVESRAKEPWYADARDAQDHPTHSDVPGECGSLVREIPFYFADWTHRQSEFAGLATGLHCWPGDIAMKTREPDQRARLANVHVPTLVTAGRLDFLFPPKWGKVTADAIHGAKLIVFEHSGHMAHLEEPDAVAEAFAAFATAP